MYLKETASSTVEPQTLELKYLGIVLDSNVIFKTQAKTGSNTTFQIRNCFSTKAARMYMNAMIISHLIYCLTCWLPQIAFAIVIYWGKN